MIDLEFAKSSHSSPSGMSYGMSLAQMFLEKYLLIILPCFNYRYVVSYENPGAVTRLTEPGCSHAVSLDKVGG